MFIKLTKSDGVPVWLNPEFIVRIESWKTGSAVAVAGDGDFEVREMPSSILALCQATPAPAPVPTPTPVETPPKSKTRGRRKKAETPPAEKAPVADPPTEAPQAEEPAVAVEETNPEPVSVPAEVPAQAVVLPAETLFPDAPDEVACAAAILKKNRCRSRKRILNTLKSRNPKMSMDDARSLLEQMEARGFVSIDEQGHAVFN